MDTRRSEPVIDKGKMHPSPKISQKSKEIKKQTPKKATPTKNS